MSADLQRALQAMELGRNEMAVDSLRKHLLTHPNDANAHSYLAFCLTDLERFDDAEVSAGTAIAKAPDAALSHQAMATVLTERRRYAEAEKFAREALRLDPASASIYVTLGQILYAQKKWRAVVEMVDQGLTLEPDETSLLNIRARALRELGEKEAANATLDAALENDPENPWTHCNVGWTTLRNGDAKRALDHFKEALRLDPTLDAARHGVIEAIKARNPIYALLLRYFFWMQSLSGQKQAALILGGYVGQRVLRSIAKENPGVAPFIWPIIIAYAVFCYLTWVATPLFNLLLRLHAVGRLALDREQIRASNVLGLVLLTGILGGLAYLALDSAIGAVIGLVSLGLVIPVAGTFGCEKGWPRTAAALFTGALTILGVVLIVKMILLVGTHSNQFVGFQTLASIFMIGCIASPWALIILSQIRPKV